MGETACAKAREMKTARRMTGVTRELVWLEQKWSKMVAEVGVNRRGWPSGSRLVMERHEVCGCGDTTVGFYTGRR